MRSPPTARRRGTAWRSSRAWGWTMSSRDSRERRASLTRSHVPCRQPAEASASSRSTCRTAVRPGSEHYEYKLAWLGSLRELVAAGPRGDRGVRRHEHRADRRRRLRSGRLRRADPCHRARARRTRRELVALACTTSSATAGPNERVFTYWDYRAGMFHQDLGMRIDLVLAGAPVAERVRAASVTASAQGQRSERSCPGDRGSRRGAGRRHRAVMPPPSRPVTKRGAKKLPQSR